MKIQQSKGFGLTEHDVTDESVFSQRRKLLKSMGFIGAGSLLSLHSNANAGVLDWFENKPKSSFEQVPLTFNHSATSIADAITLEQKAMHHNNFYEFGTNKAQPAELAQKFKVNPWQLTISGEVNQPITLDYDDLFKRFTLEQRIYRLRCVETWSMVIPWIGFELASLIKQAEPTSKAKYVAFETLYDPAQMPGQKSRYVGGGIEYPYVEGLRLDEAMNSLTMLAVGMYGKSLPPQNGAPIRLVVPWKYGFKSIKSIVSIKLVSEQPPTTWNKLLPNEYGFYANVNPDVAHPRWSQASERRITKGGLLEQKRIATLPFNGYGEQVAHLYKNMDLAKYY